VEVQVGQEIELVEAEQVVIEKVKTLQFVLTQRHL
jgi:hypothetical protein